MPSLFLGTFPIGCPKQLAPTCSIHDAIAALQKVAQIMLLVLLTMSSQSATRKALGFSQDNDFYKV